MTEIRKGDLIKTELEYDGVTVTLTGVAHSKVGAFWYTEKGGEIHNEYSPAKVTVLQRALPTETGAVLKSAAMEDGTTVGMLVRDKHGDWFDPAEFVWYVSEEISEFEIGEVQ